MRSMTAYAQVHKRKNSQSIQLILRSLNYRYLDIFVHNLSAEDVLLEERIKREIKKGIYRGRVEVYLLLKNIAGDVYIDEKNLIRYLSKMRKMAKKFKLGENLSIRDILSLPQVVHYKEKNKIKNKLVLSALNEGLKRLLKFKEKEGKNIKGQMAENLKKLRKNLREIKGVEPLPMSDTGNSKEDIDEEVSLISFYANRLEKKINSKEARPAGKYIDFLSQEILRELNAASSKTKNKKIAALIVEAKDYLERIREQAQNVE